MGSILGCASAPLLLLAGFLVSRNVNPLIARDTFLYLSLNALVLPFAFMESIYNGIKNANGKPESPFIRMILMLALKVLFNFVFIYWFRLGIVGCVLASLFANVIITVWMFYELFVKEDPGRLEIRGFHFDFSAVRQLWHVGSPAMLTSFLLNLGFFLINRETEKYGPIILNGQEGSRATISSVCFILPGAFGSAVTTMVSMHVGAGNAGKARRACIAGCGRQRDNRGHHDRDHRSSHRRRSRFCLRARRTCSRSRTARFTSTLIRSSGFGVCMTVQGAFIGLGRTKVPLVISVLRIWFLRYIFILATERSLAYYSVFWGNLFF